MRMFRQCLSVAILGLGASLGAQGQDLGKSADVNSASSSRPRLVIAGASYAGDWKQPDLPGYEVVNKGVGGEETQNVLARFERDVVQLKPRAVLIWGHINNIHRAPNRNYEAAGQRAIADYQKMIALARANQITVILATEVTLPEAMGFVNRVAAFVGRVRGKTGYAERINGHVKAVNAWLRTYAAKERIQLLDFEKVLDDGDGFRKVEYTKEDGSHITPEGYAALTKYTRAQLAQR